jgi:dTDP-4-dehydrorhamnose reductase
MFWRDTAKPLVLLSGKTGQIGSELEKQLAPLTRLSAFDRSEFDLEKPDAVRRVVRQLNPSIIINAAAYTAVDQAETEPEKARAVNTQGVRVLAEETERLGALLVHYSTDYVFDGAQNEPYVESDTTNPLSVYGLTKLAGEQAIQESGCFHLIFRTAWIYAATGKNFVRTIARLSQQKPVLSVVNDQRGAPTSAHDVASMTIRVLRQASLPVRGLYHMTAGGETTWYSLAQRVVSELQRRQLTAATLKPITTAEYPTLAKRPLNSVLSNKRLADDFDVNMPHWSESLQLTLKELVA